MPSQKFKIYFPFILVAFLGTMIGLTLDLLVGNSPDEDDKNSDGLEHATLVSPPKRFPPFQLTDHMGKQFTERSLEGKWSFIFIGYTSCPDICPTTFATFKLAANQFERLKMNNINFILLTIDPETDSPEKLAAFISNYNKDFIGLTGQMDRITAITKELGLLHNTTMTKNEPHDHAKMNMPKEEINHSGHVLLISPKAELYATFSPPVEMDHLVQTLVNISPPTY